MKIKTRSTLAILMAFLIGFASAFPIADTPILKDKKEEEWSIEMPKSVLATVLELTLLFLINFQNSMPIWQVELILLLVTYWTLVLGLNPPSLITVEQICFMVLEPAVLAVLVISYLGFSVAEVMYTVVLPAWLACWNR